jgi:hypothetical protein
VGLAGVGVAVAGVAAAALVLTGGGGPRGEPARGARGASPPAAAVGDGDSVVCRAASCTQGARVVAAPIEGGPCRRAGAAARWARIDRHAPEPILICLPAANPPAGALPPPLPSLVGSELDRAELALDRLGIGHDTSGGGVFGILDRGNWTVCATSPPAGLRLAAGAKARLFVDHSC